MSSNVCAEDELMHNVNLTEDLCSGIFQYVFTVLIILYSSCLSEAGNIPIPEQESCQLPCMT